MAEDTGEPCVEGPPPVVRLLPVFPSLPLEKGTDRQLAGGWAEGQSHPELRDSQRGEGVRGKRRGGDRDSGEKGFALHGF